MQMNSNNIWTILYPRLLSLNSVPLCTSQPRWNAPTAIVPFVFTSTEHLRTINKVISSFCLNQIKDELFYLFSENHQRNVCLTEECINTGKLIVLWAIITISTNFDLHDTIVLCSIYKWDTFLMYIYIYTKLILCHYIHIMLCKNILFISQEICTGKKSNLIHYWTKYMLLWMN